MSEVKFNIMQNVCDYLNSKTYPGRGIVAFHPSGQNKLFLGYWIMGRSENSRNRVFDEIYEGKWKGCGIRTIAADDSKVEDPHLIIYNARIAQHEKNVIVITNGDQTDTIAESLLYNDNEKIAFVQALMTRTFEDDAPNFTPRISLVANANTGAVAFSILKCADAKTISAQRSFSFYEKVPSGEGYLLTTYVDDASPLPSSGSEPVMISCEAKDLSEFRDMLWSSLNSDNKISLYTEEIDIETGKSRFEYVNKFERIN